MGKSGRSRVTIDMNKKYDIYTIIKDLVDRKVKDNTVLYVDFHSSNAHSHKTDFWLSEKDTVCECLTEFVKENMPQDFEDAEEVDTYIRHNPKTNTFNICFTRECDGDQGVTRFEMTIYGVDKALLDKVFVVIKPLLEDTEKVEFDKCFEETDDEASTYIGW